MRINAITACQSGSQCNHLKKQVNISKMHVEQPEQSDAVSFKGAKKAIYGVLGAITGAAFGIMAGPLGAIAGAAVLGRACAKEADKPDDSYSPYEIEDSSYIQFYT